MKPNFPLGVSKQKVKKEPSIIELSEQVKNQVAQTIDRIDHIANTYCQTYPDINNLSVFEKLWAIEQTIAGLEMACKDWSNVVEELMKRYNIPQEEVMNISAEELKKRYEMKLSK